MPPVRARHTAVWTCLAVFVGMLSAPARSLAAPEDEEAVRIYRKLKPSVVSLQSAEGSGTGVIVRADGLILTNAHVVSSPLPYEVQVETDGAGGGGGDAARQTFRKVQVVGYHPRLDLALVKVDPKEPGAGRRPLTAATLSRKKGNPGQRVYVIGDPAGGGKVLTKSITSGMLSAVDREVEGERYYQTDAAINPGNSGGPMCDRAGGVLGLVTFKFTDVQAVGFAIPLHDVDLKAFVPLTERKVDRAAADELLKEAEHFGRLSEQASKREGEGSASDRLYSLYAAMCYRMALAHDPANPDTYYNVGMFLRSIDEDRAAAAYLARAIQIRPWDATGDPYRELGFALVKQKLDDKALVAWNEGRAKFPYNAKTWEDLAVFHINHNDPAAAARAASIALLISDKSTRVDVMRKIRDDARGRVSGKAADGLDKALERPALVKYLDELLAACNKARKARAVVVHKPFETLLNELGGPPLPGVKSKPPEVLARLDILGDGDGDEDADAAQPDPNATAAKSPAKSAKSDKDDWIAQGSSDKPTTPPTKRPADKAKPDDGDWIGAGATAGGTTTETTKGKAPQPAVTGTPLAQTAKTVGSAEVTYLKDVKDVRGLQWSADGKFAFVQQGDGLLRKVSVPELVEQRHLAIGTNVVGLGRCKLGLVVALGGTQQVWLLDDDLNVQKRVNAAGISRLAASPALPLVFASGGDDLLNVLDMSAGRPVAQIRPADLREQRGLQPEAQLLGFRFATLTPDGRYLFTEGRDVLHRLKVNGAKLRYDEGSPGIGSNPQAVVVSADSRYVAMPSGGGNGGIEGQPRRPYATYVFRCDNLRQPVMTIESGAYPRMLGFDAAAKCLYAQNHEKSLMVFSPGGLKLEEYKLDRRGDDTRAYYVHPSGHKLFLAHSDALAWVVRTPAE